MNYVLKFELNAYLYVWLLCFWLRVRPRNHELMVGDTRSLLRTLVFNSSESGVPYDVAAILAPDKDEVQHEHKGKFT